MDKPKKMCVICGRFFNPVLASTISCGCDGRRRQSVSKKTYVQDVDEQLKDLVNQAVSVLQNIPEWLMFRPEKKMIAEWLENILIPELQRKEQAYNKTWEHREVTTGRILEF